MYKDFAKKAALGLAAEEFGVLGGGIGSIDEDTREIVLFKNLSPVIYAVALINADIISPEEYEAGDIKSVLSEFVEKNSMGRLVYITVFAGGKNIPGFFEYAKSRPYIPEGSPINVFWCADTQNEVLLTPPGMPDTILDIQDVLKAAFSGGALSEEEFGAMLLNTVSSAGLEVKSKVPALTYALIAVNALIFIFMSYLGDEGIILKYGLSSARVLKNGEYYRLFTSMFLHGGVYHLLYNSFSLYIFGTRAERYFGRVVFAWIYIISGLFGGIMSVFFTGGLSIGASGAVYGVIGAVSVLAWIKKRSIDGISYPTFILIAVLSAAFGFLDPSIDSAAHLGGLISGAVAGLFVSGRKNKTN